MCYSYTSLKRKMHINIKRLVRERKDKMNIGTIARKKKRKFNIGWYEIYEKIPYMVGLIAFVVVVAIARMEYISIPKVHSKSISYEIYLPQKYEVVESVTNTFENHSLFMGGAGGVGLPQFNRSVKAYRLHEGTNIHYIDISVEENSSFDFGQPERLMVDSYDVDESKVFHTTVTSIESPEFFSKKNFFSGYYKVGDATIIGGKLKIDWYGGRNTTQMTMFLMYTFFFAVIIGWLSQFVILVVEYVVDIFKK